MACAAPPSLLVRGRPSAVAGCRWSSRGPSSESSAQGPRLCGTARTATAFNERPNASLVTWSTGVRPGLWRTGAPAQRLGPKPARPSRRQRPSPRTTSVAETVISRGDVDAARGRREVRTLTGTSRRPLQCQRRGTDTTHIHRCGLDAKGRPSLGSRRAEVVVGSAVGSREAPLGGAIALTGSRKWQGDLVIPERLVVPK